MYKLLLLVATCFIVATSSPAASPATFRAVDPLCENLTAPLLIDTPKPRFSWRIESDGTGVSQSAYQLRVFEEPNGSGAARPLLDTGRVDSSESIAVLVPTLEIQPKSRYRWDVQVWDQNGHTSGWRTSSTFETGLMQTPWPASWLTTGRPVAKNEPARAR